MNTKRNTTRWIVSLSGLMMLILVISLTACQSTAADGEMDDSDEMGASEIWERNCARCHNIRSPSTLSDKQWETAVMHMRVRANLTPKEQRLILELLKAGN